MAPSASPGEPSSKAINAMLTGSLRMPMSDKAASAAGCS